MMETTFLATSEKLWPCAGQHLGRPAQFVRHEAAEERFDRQPAFLCAQVAARRFAPLVPDRQRMARLVVIGAQAGQPLIAHQHQEAGFGEISGCGAVEAGRAVLDGIEAVGR